MTIKTDKVMSEKDKRTHSPVGTEYMLNLAELQTPDTLSDAKRLVSLYSDYSYRTLVFPLALLLLLVSSFIPVYSDGGLKAAPAHSDYAHAITDHVQIDFERLADAVYLAEGGPKAKVPYGIFYPGCSKSSPQYCRKIAINTFKSSYKRFLSSNSSLTYIEFLQRSYAPLNANNDPSGLNRHWIKNVNYFLNKRSVS